MQVEVALEINDTLASVARQRAMELLEYLDVDNRAWYWPTNLRRRSTVSNWVVIYELFAKVAHEWNAGVIVGHPRFPRFGHSTGSWKWRTDAV